MSPETRQCQNCKTEFRIDTEDFAFYEKMKVPAPTFCPECRLQRRLAWRAERGFHHRKCDRCGKVMIATYPQSAAFPVYCRECWWSDAWDAKEHGKAYGWDKPFFQQFFELQQKVPAIALQVANSVNCDYTNQIVDCKNCYLLTSAGWDEDCYYSYRILHSKNIVDSSFLLQSQNCYWCFESLGIAYGAFDQSCVDSLDISFCYDMRGSQNCFMSSNLRMVNYVFRNRQLSKEEYEKAMKDIDLGSYRNSMKYKAEFQELLASSIHPYASVKNSMNSTGNILANTKNSRSCFSCSELEDCAYCIYVDGGKDCMDVNTGELEQGYEVSTGGVKSANIKLCADVWPEVRDLTYCTSCRNGAHSLFGCIGLKKSEYCILNKQYTKEEYEELVPKIIQHMDAMPYIDSKGRIYKYGEFFPVELSHSPYNETHAQDYFLLTKEQAKAEGYVWRDAEERQLNITKQAADLPDHVKDTDDSVLSEVIGCEHADTCNERCTIGFRIIPAELKFYRERNIALPRLCSNCRNYERLRQQNPFRLWKRTCMCRTGHFHGAASCPNEFETSYAPDRPEIIYCEQCYQAEIV